MTTYTKLNDTSKDSTTHMKLSEIKKDLLKAVRFEDEVTVFVKVYDCNEGEQTYDVEVQYYIDGEYTDCFVSDTFGEGEESVSVKRAKAVSKTVAKWFVSSEVEVITDVEVYTN